MISSPEIFHGKVLIVDDQKVNVLLLEQLLRGAGYVSVTSTMDPGEVCQLHRKNLYDLILLDLVMPGTDGPDVSFEAQHGNQQKATCNRLTTPFRHTSLPRSFCRTGLRNFRDGLTSSLG